MTKIIYMLNNSLLLLKIPELGGIKASKDQAAGFNTNICILNLLNTTNAKGSHGFKNELNSQIQRALTAT